MSFADAPTWLLVLGSERFLEGRFVTCHRRLQMLQIHWFECALPPPSQFPLRHNLTLPVVPQSLDFSLLFLWQLQQAEPLGYPVRGDSVLLPELNPGKVVTEHFIMEFSGENEWISVGASAGYGDVRAEGFQ